MDDDFLQSLLQSMGNISYNDQDAPNNVAAMLISETVKFRDKLKKETGNILTVADTRTALDALEYYLFNGSFPTKITPEQKALAQIWIDRLTRPDTRE